MGSNPVTITRWGSIVDHVYKWSTRICGKISVSLYGGCHKWGYPEMVTPLQTWMIWGKPYFRKPPYHYKSGWWFGTFFIFPYIGNNHPNWLSYFSEGFKPPTSNYWQPCSTNVHGSKVWRDGRCHCLDAAKLWDPGTRWFCPGVFFLFCL